MRFGGTNLRFDLGSWPVRDPGLRSPAALRERAVCVSRGFASTLILDERVQLGSLFIVQEIVKLLQRRMNRLDGGNHRLDPLLHGCEPLGRRQRYLCRTGGFNVLRRFHVGVGEIIQSCTLGVIDLKRLLDLIYREACDVAAVITAQLRQLVGHRSPAAGRLPNVNPRTAAAWWEIGYEVIIAVEIEQTRVNVIVAVIPEERIVAVTPQRVVINVVIGERPE